MHAGSLHPYAALHRQCIEEPYLDEQLRLCAATGACDLQHVARAQPHRVVDERHARVHPLGYTPRKQVCSRLVGHIEAQVVLHTDLQRGVIWADFVASLTAAWFIPHSAYDKESKQD